MRRAYLIVAILISASIFLTSCGSPAANTTAPNSNTAGPVLNSGDVKKMLDQLRTAIASNDVNALNRIYSDDYTFIGPDGQMYTKAQRLDAIRSGQTKTDSISFDDPKIIVHGDTAVVTTGATVKGTLNGVPQSGTSVVTIVFAQTKDGLKVIHGHPSAPATSSPAGANTNAARGTNPTTNANVANR